MATFQNTLANLFHLKTAVEDFRRSWLQERQTRDDAEASANQQEQTVINLETRVLDLIEAVRAVKAEHSDLCDRIKNFRSAAVRAADLMEGLQRSAGPFIDQSAEPVHLMALENFKASWLESQRARDQAVAAADQAKLDLLDIEDRLIAVIDALGSAMDDYDAASVVLRNHRAAVTNAQELMDNIERLAENFIVNEKSVTDFFVSKTVIEVSSSAEVEIVKNYLADTDLWTGSVRIVVDVEPVDDIVIALHRCDLCLTAESAVISRTEMIE